MSDSTSIEWTNTTWNPTTGCDKVSPGCGLARPGSDDEGTGQTGGCYALTMARRLKAMGQPKYQRDGDPRTSGPGFGITVHPDTLDEPFTWARPRKVFVNSMSDLFHDKVDASFIARVFAVMAATPQHTYQVLTKRHARMRSLLSSPDFIEVVQVEFDQFADEHDVDLIPGPWPLPNVWVGVSVETQQWADIRIPALLGTPAAVRFLSCEPLLGPLRLHFPPFWCYGHGRPGSECPNDLHLDRQGIDWVIAGGESGPGARPMHPDWARSLRDQCQAAGVAFHFKQHGAWAPWASHPEGENGPGDTFVNPDGTCGHVWWNEDLGYPTNYAGPWGEHSQIVSRVGKKRAGRELDGRTWDEFPTSMAVTL